MSVTRLQKNWAVFDLIKSPDDDDIRHSSAIKRGVRKDEDDAQGSNSGMTDGQRDMGGNVSVEWRGNCDDPRGPVFL